MDQVAIRFFRLRGSGKKELSEPSSRRSRATGRYAVHLPAVWLPSPLQKKNFHEPCDFDCSGIAMHDLLLSG